MRKPVGYRPDSAYKQPQQSKPKKQRHSAKPLIIIIIILGLAGIAAYGWSRVKTANDTHNYSSSKAVVVPTPSNCAGNSLANFVLVSISQRHMWACSGSTQVYDSYVVTGMENLPADLTPTGTYTIYAKQTNLYLNGSDSTGSWHDYVYYWMPFLSNQYGVYGFHDATWRPSNAFGNISPYSSNASHGCVEMPLATAKWLFNWAPIGTTVSIKS